MAHVHLIHGINEGLTDPSWPWDFVGHSLNKGISAFFQTEHYWAGPTPIWNHLITNPKYGKALAKREILFQQRNLSPIYIAAHSNGTNIAMHMIRELAKVGIGIEKFLLFGSTIHSDVEKSGLTELPVGQCIAYCSPKDNVAKYLQSTPKFYGSLGAKGFERNGKPTGTKTKGFTPLKDLTWGDERHKYVTRWFPDFGHSDWFAKSVSDLTFNCILEDFGFIK